MSVAFVFSSFFPAALLGLPDEDNALSVLPAHRLLARGKAYTAFRLYFLGALTSSFFSFIFLVFFLIFLKDFYQALKPIIPLILLFILVVMLFSNKYAFIVIVLSSALGYMTVNYNTILPLLTGFFAMSNLILSLFSTGRQPTQRLKSEISISRFDIIHSSLVASVLASFFSLIPAISSGISATASKIFGRFNTEEFLVLIGSTNMAYMVFSFFTLSLLGISRSGSAVLLSNVENVSAFFMAALVLLSSLLSFLILESVYKRLLPLYTKLKQKSINIAAAFVLLLIVFLTSSYFGLLVFLASTSIGLLSNELGVKRINCMSALIFPTVLLIWQ